MKKQILFAIFAATQLFIGVHLSAQMGINTDNSLPDNSAMLDVKSNSKGMLIPRITQSQISAILTPANGLVVFCTTDNKFYAYVASANIWKEVLYGSGTIAPLNGDGQPCPGIPTVTYNGITYNTVLNGTQCWFKENLNVGTRINGSQEQSDNGIFEKYCYNDLESNCDVYGGLYQWNEMMQYTTTPGVQGICPTGWHLPTDVEWTTLSTYLGGEVVAGGKMKEAGTTHWLSPNTGATNSSGFTALPGGNRYIIGNFYDLTYNAYFWSSSQFDASNAWHRHLYYLSELVNRYNYYKTYGFSARCLKDN